MKPEQDLRSKILPLSDLQRRVEEWKAAGQTVAFTNGCFDVLHAGHIASLTQAASEADRLVVGLNADGSVRNLKGPTRPLNNEDARAVVLSALAVVDAVTIFSEPTPINTINTIHPDVLVKGGDYTVEQIVGAKEVIERGGRVVINPIVEGYSTTGIIQKMQNAVAPPDGNQSTGD